MVDLQTPRFVPFLGRGDPGRSLLTRKPRFLQNSSKCLPRLDRMYDLVRLTGWCVLLRGEGRRGVLFSRQHGLFFDQGRYRLRNGLLSRRSVENVRSGLNLIQPLLDLSGHFVFGRSGVHGRVCRPDNKPEKADGQDGGNEQRLNVAVLAPEGDAEYFLAILQPPALHGHKRCQQNAEKSRR